MDAKTVSPNKQEVAKADYGLGGLASYTNMLIENPDSVLDRKGQNYEIYDELLRDDQVKSTFQQRRSGLTSKSWHIEPASDSAEDKAAADFIQEQLEKIGFDDITDKMLYGVFYGHAVAEIMWEMDGGKVGLADIKVRDRSRFKYDRKRRLFLIDSNNPNGKKMPERKFWTYSVGASHSDNPYGLGLAHSLYWPVFFKRSDIKFWLVFLEKFGMPTTALRMPPGQMNDPRTVARARAVLAGIQADSGVIIPDDMVVELIEAGRSGTADYSEMVKLMDRAISKVVLSQTMTTDDGSSRSQAEVHRSVGQEVIDADADTIAESFRRTVGTWLTEWNFPNAKPPFLVRDTEPEEDLTARAERDNKVFALGYEPTEEYIQEVYGQGWRKKEPQPVSGQLMSDGKGAMPADFSEISELLLMRAAGRADQQDIADAAEVLSTKYKELYGRRVERLLAYLDDSGDIETFEKHLKEMLSEPPPAEAVEAIQRSNIFGRLSGLFRGQRDS